ncbi:MAG: hypothetical protein LLG02_07190 [Pelosinus sp.]|nr:hypothetical protein [Pelosinus sp.]
MFKEMRRQDRALSEQEIWSLLRKGPFANNFLLLNVLEYDIKGEAYEYNI